MEVRENNNKIQWTEHTFAICAYGESPYLEDCVKSLISQRLKSHICLCTATPNAYIEAIATAYNLPLYINEGEKGIGGDWNFALSKAGTPYVTLAHQDDIYERNYTWEMKKALNRSKEPLLLFSNYGEIKGGKKIQKNRILGVKRLLLAPLALSFFQKSMWMRRRILSLGNPICCPSVTYVMKGLPDPVFITSMRSNLDWDAWERVSRLPGEFCYMKKILMYHRIHEGSETSAVIRDNKRTEEDMAIFQRFWGKTMAKMINKCYKNSEKFNGK